MDKLYHDLILFLTGAIPKALILAIVGYFAARLISKSLTKLFYKHMSVHQRMILQRFTFYLILFLFLGSAITELGFHLSVLLSATGILTVAIGIASQTSMSNIVSGLFIIGEKSFRIGDTILVGELQGEIMSIDFLSVKIRTDDYMMVRIPNETLIKSAIVNRSYFPIRRIDLSLVIAYKEDLDNVKNILFEVAKDNDLCLADPKPSVSIKNLGNTAINIQFYVWAKRENSTKVKNSVQEELKKVFAEKGIEMPISSPGLLQGLNFPPFPIKIIPDHVQS